MQTFSSYVTSWHPRRGQTGNTEHKWEECEHREPWMEWVNERCLFLQRQQQQLHTWSPAAHFKWRSEYRGSGPECSCTGSTCCDHLSWRWGTERCTSGSSTGYRASSGGLTTCNIGFSSGKSGVKGTLLVTYTVYSEIWSLHLIHP